MADRGAGSSAVRVGSVPKRPAGRPPLLGRDADLDLAVDFALGRSQPRYPVLLVTGGPGIGKTALLDATAGVAERQGIQVVRTGAVEFEADLAYGGLNQMLHPLMGWLTSVSPIHQEALGSVLGLRAGPVPSELIVGAAVLAVVSAASTPLLFVVDDAALLDRASAMTVAFVARRVDPGTVRFLLSARDDTENAFVRSGFDIHPLAALSDSDADALLAERFPDLPARLRRRIRELSEGNPLALLDLPAGLDVGAEGLPDVDAPAERLRALYARQLLTLPAPTRAALLFLALAGTETDPARRLLWAASARGDLAPATRLQLVAIDNDSGQVQFRHPLIRAAVVESATPEDRQVAHAELADALRADPRRRAWHLGRSVTWPDPGVATELERLAEELLRSGDSREAMSTLVRAAELTEDRQVRARRIGRAAFLGSVVTGDLATSEDLLLKAQPDPDEPLPLPLVAAGAHATLSREGDAVGAHRLLVAALDDVPDPVPADPATSGVLHLLLFTSLYAGRTDLWSQTRRQLDRVRPELPETLAVFRGVFADGTAPDPSALHRLDAALGSLALVADPLRINRLATAGAHLDRLDAARRALQRVVDDGRSGGAVARQIQSLLLLAMGDWLAGDWPGVDDRTEEALGLCDELGYTLLSTPARYLRALADAVRGADHDADRAVEYLLQWAAPRGLHTVAAYASHVQCLRAIGREEFDEAYRHAASVDPAGTILTTHPAGSWMIFDLVEAATRSGHDREARAHVDLAVAADLHAVSPRLALLVDGSRALVADRDWSDLFARALREPGAERFPFDRARVQLAYGERLRRERLVAAARTELAASAAVFERLGAMPWVDRATRELRAAGGSPTDGGAGLTSQERAIAHLAATGLTNKEIGTRLFLSPRTVSTHLSHVYAKLGVRSRREVGVAIAPPSDR